MQAKIFNGTKIYTILSGISTLLSNDLFSGEIVVSRNSFHNRNNLNGKIACITLYALSHRTIKDCSIPYINNPADLYRIVFHTS